MQGYSNRPVCCTCSAAFSDSSEGPIQSSCNMHTALGVGRGILKMTGFTIYLPTCYGSGHQQSQCMLQGFASVAATVAQGSTLWGAAHTPQNRELFMITAGDGSLHLFKYHYPDQRYALALLCLKRKHQSADCRVMFVGQAGKSKRVWCKQNLTSCNRLLQALCCQLNPVCRGAQVGASWQW